jgi:hypothetical protein
MMTLPQALTLLGILTDTVQAQANHIETVAAENVALKAEIERLGGKIPEPAAPPLALAPDPGEQPPAAQTQ